MPQFPTHTVDSAPEASKNILAGAQKQLGFVPNLYANMAESPATLNAYTTLAGNFQESSLSLIEQQIVLLSASVVNGCEFCVAAHSVIAKNMVKVKTEIVEALRNNTKISDTKYEALATFTRAVVNDRGWVKDDAVDAFLATGYTKAQALEVVLGVSLKTLSNYSNHLTKTETNPEFSSEAWTKNS